MMMEILSLSGQKIGSNVIEASGKSSLILLQPLMRQFEIPHYVIFDCDGHVTDAGNRKKHADDNTTAFRLAECKVTDVFPSGGLSDYKVTAWETHIEDVLDLDFGALKDQAISHGRKSAGHLKDCRKNPFFVSGSMEYAWKNGCRFERISSVCDKILKTGQSIR